MLGDLDSRKIQKSHIPYVKKCKKSKVLQEKILIQEIDQMNRFGSYINDSRELSKSKVIFHSSAFSVPKLETLENFDHQKNVSTLTRLLYKTSMTMKRNSSHIKKL